MNLQNKIKDYLQANNIKAWEIKHGAKPNPFNIGTTYFYDLYRGAPVPLGARLKLIHFFTEQDKKKASKNPL